MTFDEILDQVRAMLQQRGRVTYRSLKRRFDLDEEYLEDLKGELIRAEGVAADEGGDVLVWKGKDSPGSSVQSPESKQVQGQESKVQSQENQPPTPSPQRASGDSLR